MMNLERRIEILTALGERLAEEKNLSPEVTNAARIANPWFTEKAVRAAVHAVATQYLDRKVLEEWMQHYRDRIIEMEPKKIGLILAGNIPLVGIHDIITVFITGNIALLKLSDRDTILTKFVIESLVEIDSDAKHYFSYVERLREYDAVIATGSNSTSRYFEKYFSKVPNLIRKNRNAVAIVYADATDEDMQALSDDMLSYFGLGCRNVSKLYLEEGVELSKIFEPTEAHKFRADHNKYKNNYDYTYAMFLMNKEEFFTNDFFILRPSVDLASRISTAHYEYFTDSEKLATNIAGSARADTMCRQ